MKNKPKFHIWKRTYGNSEVQYIVSWTFTDTPSENPSTAPKPFESLKEAKSFAENMKKVLHDKEIISNELVEEIV
jgi:hypothetical protein